MKLQSVLLALLVLLVPAATVSASDVSFEGSLGAYSSYIWRGYKLSADALQLQPSATVSTSGFSLNVWADYDFDTDDWLEADYTAAYAFAVDRLSLEVGAIHYDVKNGLDSDEVYVSAAYDTFLNPSLTVYYDFNEGDGAFLVAGIGHPIELSPAATLDLSAAVSVIVNDSYVAVDAQGEEFTGLFHGELGAGVSIALREGLTLAPSVGYTFALSDDASDAIESGSTEADDSFVYGAVTISVSF